MSISDREGFWKHLSIFYAHGQNYQYLLPQHFVRLSNTSIFFFFLYHYQNVFCSSIPSRLPIDFQTSLLLMMTTWKLSVETLIIFTVWSLPLPTVGKFLNLIIIHTLKKAKSYYLWQSSRNKCIEGFTCLPKGTLPEIFLGSHPAASATELARLTTNELQLHSRGFQMYMKINSKL